MVDYTRSTGTSGTMMIRDTGSVVEFWLNSNNSTTFSASLPWGFIINGVSQNKTYNYPAGAGWRKLSEWAISTSQTVQFRLGNTGTSGFGGPTTFNQAISRGTVPPAPNAPVISEITDTSMRVIFSGNGDGGASITAWQIGFSADPNSIYGSIDSFDHVFEDLDPGVTYYFWARGVNTVGYGPWSVRSSARTLSVPETMGSPVISDVRQTQVQVDFEFTVGDGGTPILEFEVGWTTTALADPDDTTTGSFPTIATGLDPGVLYYFSVRARNAVGWGNWGFQTAQKTVAGARVKVGAVWKEAIPYVRSGGVWKLAEPWGRIAGEWKRTL